MNIEHLISFFLTFVIAIMGWIMQRKTERIKIMENQLSDKKYKAYANTVEIFYSVLKDIIMGRDSNQRKKLDEMLESKKTIFMYGSDNVLKAFNNWLCSTAVNETQYAKLNAILNFMLEIRKDMKGKTTKITQYDLLVNLMQNKDEANKLWKKMHNNVK